MEYQWALYLLVFVFGYVTCKTFYFMRETRLGLIMLKLSHCLALYTIVKGLEKYQYVKNLKISQMVNSGESEQVITAYQINFDKEIQVYKNKCINEIIKIHPKFYRDIVSYHDWNSAMVFLNTEGAEFIKRFHKEKDI